MQAGDGSIESSLLEAHVLQRVLQEQDILAAGLRRLEAVLLVDGPPDSPGGLSTVAGEPFGVDGQVDIVAAFAGLTVDVAKVVPGLVVGLPGLEVGLGGLTQRRVDEVVAQSRLIDDDVTALALPSLQT